MFHGVNSSKEVKVTVELGIDRDPFLRGKIALPKVSYYPFLF